jgi:lia operon protein LiaG
MSRPASRHVAPFVVTAFILLAATALPAQERYQVTGAHVAVYDLAGHVDLKPGTGSAVLVELTRGGADGRELKVAQGTVDGRETLRVIYPSDDVRYPELQYHGSTELRVREDGTFGGDEDHGRWWNHEGHRVRISDHGDFEAFADLVLSVPEGQRLDVYLAVGKLSATNVHGQLRLDGASSDITASGLVGRVVVNVGSGDVRLRDVQGDASLETGSGDVDATAVRGDRLHIETGSGNATVTAPQTRLLDVNTGSGDLGVTGATAQEVKLDAGSGDVRVALSTNPHRLDVETGSGEVTLSLPPSYGAMVDIDTGSGGIDVDFPVTARKFGRDHLTGQIGDGSGTLRIETGSGGVHLTKAAPSQ